MPELSTACNQIMDVYWHVYTIIRKGSTRRLGPLYFDRLKWKRTDRILSSRQRNIQKRFRLVKCAHETFKIFSASSEKLFVRTINLIICHYNSASCVMNSAMLQSSKAKHLKKLFNYAEQVLNFIFCFRWKTVKKKLVVCSHQRHKILRQRHLRRIFAALKAAVTMRICPEANKIYLSE